MSHKLKLLLTIFTHYIIFGCFAATVVLGLFTIPVYVSITLTALIVRVIFSPNECPLTALENAYRKKLSLRPSKGFLKDYIIFPKRTFYSLYVELYKK
jgi:hypothetical protein